jgi:Leucine-rich repeat (LRR) protein
VLEFAGLKSLHMHANRICDLGEIDKLKKLKNLTALTLHGNPCENLPCFRHYVLSKLTNLKHLNFSGVSKADKATASVIVKTNKMNLVAVVAGKNDKPKAKKKDDDED